MRYSAAIVSMSIKFNRPRSKPALISPACSLFLIGGRIKTSWIKICKCLARKIVLLIFQYFIASRVCCNKVELHCLALLLWINGYCFDMVLFWFVFNTRTYSRSSKLEVKTVAHYSKQNFQDVLPVVQCPI